MTNINDLLHDHITLEVECIDRIYLNGYVPKLQTAGSLVYFLTQHRGHPIPSPVLLGKMTDTFVKAVKRFSKDNDIPIVRFKSGQRKDDIAADMRKKHPTKDGVVFIGIAQEKSCAFRGRKVTENGKVSFVYTRCDVYVNYYYFYLNDADFGPCFIKVCSYAPFTVKVCLNGHEWVKCQLDRQGIGYESLDNGFRSCDKPDTLQAICDQLCHVQIERFFRKWIERLPWPLTQQDRAAGYCHQLSVWQLETSLTQVFDRPRYGRQFFEEVIRDNLDQGRPDRVQLLFDRKIIKSTPGKFRTRVVTRGVHPSLHVEYKKSHVKQYFKENRALRTETTINDPRDFNVNKGLRNLPYLQVIGRKTNRRLLDVQRVSHNCGMSADAIGRVVASSTHDGGLRASGLKLGDIRVDALFLCLTLFDHLVDGFRNSDICRHMSDLLDKQFTSGQVTYDLRRLRLKGIISRVPGRNRYFLTPYGFQVALFHNRLNARVFRPLSSALEADSGAGYPEPLITAIKRVNNEIDSLIANANISKRAA